MFRVIRIHACEHFLGKLKKPNGNLWPYQFGKCLEIPSAHKNIKGILQPINSFSAVYGNFSTVSGLVASCDACLVFSPSAFLYILSVHSLHGPPSSQTQQWGSGRVGDLPLTGQLSSTRTSCFLSRFKALFSTSGRNSFVDLFLAKQPQNL